MGDAPDDLERKKNKLIKTKEKRSKKGTKHISYDEIGILKGRVLYAQSKITDRGMP